MNGETGAVLYEKLGYTPIYPASTTKIATALFVLDEMKVSQDMMFTVSAESLKKKPVQPGNYPSYWWDADGTRMWLCTGETLSFDALLHGLMLVSVNDAANVIAEGICGEIPLFVEKMNLYLKALGCSNTHFVNPHGSHHPEHYTTAYDLALMTKKALSIPKFRETVSALVFQKSRTNKQGPSEIKQANPLLWPGGKFYYPKAIGVKTGFHSAAQNTLVAAAVHQGRVLIAVLAGVENREDRYDDAIRLFEAAFAEEERVQPVLSKQHLFSKELPGAKTLLKAELFSDLNITYYPAEEPVCRAFIHWPPLTLPIRKGDVVGEVQIIDEQGRILKKGELFAKEEVQGTFFFLLKQMFSRWF